jgi:hypothetical protein
MRTGLKVLIVVLAIFSFAFTAAGAEGRWQVGTPITTYFAGPPINDVTAKQMADGGFNLIWCTEQELDTARKYGLRAQLTAPELNPQTMNDPAQIAKLDALIERVKNHPAMYVYYIVDEPNVFQFPALGKLVTHLRERDPAHPAYINLFPTYANNDQLGTKGGTTTAYREYLRLFIEQVKPDILSYDHYHFTVSGKDGDQYFLNLGMIRQTALDAGIPFMNIVQGCTWDSTMRAPDGDEMRWLNYTSLAYGAQALSYFVYYHEAFYKERTGAGMDAGGMMRPDYSTTAQYAAARELNPQFVALASQLQPLRSLGAYHAGMVPRGAVVLPENAPFFLDFSGEGMSKMPAEGILLGYFGKSAGPTRLDESRLGEARVRPTHVLVVNLNYKSAVTTTVVGPGRLSLFDAVARKWARAAGSRVVVVLPPGGGKLIRAQ